MSPFPLPSSCAALLVLAVPSPWAQEAGVQDASAPAAGPRLGVELAAVAGEASVTFEELDEVLVWRHGLSPEGRSALQQLVELRLLEALAVEAGIRVGDEEITKRARELDAEIRAAGTEGGLAAYLEESGVPLRTFRDYLRLAILHERLTRDALGLGPEAPVSGEQQTLWLDSVLEERGLEERSHPWPDGVVATSGSLVVTRADYAEHLRTVLPDEELADACHQILLEKRARARMPDLAPEALEQAIQDEIGRRREAAEADARFQGVAYERLLSAQGLSLEALARDPAVRVAALSTEWVERTCGEDTLKRVYADEREAFDAAYGEGVEVHLLVLKAARYKNELVPRTFEEAEVELEGMKSRMQGLEDFVRLAALHSEDLATRELGGRVGVVTRGASYVPDALREAVFAALDALPDGASPAGMVLGPLRVQGGVALLGLGRPRPEPTWEVMAEHVRREMRRRFLEELVPRESMATWLDVR